jgi:Phosphosulfolactate phosphohydrolase and related enzymes
VKSPLALDQPTQSDYEVRFDWGREGLRSIAPGAGVIVVIDAISFTTTIERAVTEGLAVTPFAGRRADAVAAEDAVTGPDAVLAGPRGGSGVTLSPSSITAESVAALAPARRVVMPSWNGSRVAALAASYGVPVVAACLRNRTAVARWILAHQHALGSRAKVAIVAAGEVREDESVRFSVEDLLASGAVVDALAELGIDASSPEAAAACAAWLGLRRAAGHMLTASVSGRELIDAGQAADVVLAAESDVSDAVPVLDPDLAGGTFVNSARKDGQVDA